MYYGANDWDGPVSIHEMFDDNVDDRLLQYIPDYKINLLQPSRITDFGHYVTDIGKLFEIISVSEKANRIKELLQAEPERFKNVDNRIIRAINHYTRTEFKVDEEKEATDMCYAMQTSLDEARAEGVELGIERGIERGVELGIEQNITNVIRNMQENHFTMEQIALAIGKTVDEVKLILEKISLL